MALPPDASPTVKGILKLTNDLGGTADLPTVPALVTLVNINNPVFTGVVTSPTYVRSIGTADQMLMASGVMKNLEGWVDYSLITTTVGWSSFTIKYVSYKIVDNIMFVSFSISGSSNTGTTSFTIPFASTINKSFFLPLGLTVNNGTAINGGGMLQSSILSNIITCFITGTGGTWTGSGTKRVSGTLIVKI